MMITPTKLLLATANARAMFSKETIVHCQMELAALDALIEVAEQVERMLLESNQTTKPPTQFDVTHEYGNINAALKRVSDVRNCRKAVQS